MLVVMIGIVILIVVAVMHFDSFLQIFGNSLHTPRKPASPAHMLAVSLAFSCSAHSCKLVLYPPATVFHANCPEH